MGGELGSLFDRLHAGELNENLKEQLQRLRMQTAELEEFLNSPVMQEFDRLVDEWNRKTGDTIGENLCK